MTQPDGARKIALASAEYYEDLAHRTLREYDDMHTRIRTHFRRTLAEMPAGVDPDAVYRDLAKDEEFKDMSGKRARLIAMVTMYANLATMYRLKGQAP
jgi:hypothetical protein